MGVHFKRLPEYALELSIYYGPVSYDELLRNFRRRDCRANWLSIFGATADLTGIEVSHFPELKRAVDANDCERGEGEPARRQALVDIPNTKTDNFVRFWRNYIYEGVQRPRERAIFTTTDAAGRWLGLPAEAMDAIAAEARCVEAALADAASPSPLRFGTSTDVAAEAR